METASRYGSKPDTYSYAMAKDVTLEVTMDGNGPQMGENAQLVIVFKNESSEHRSATINSQVAVMYYTGVLKGIVKKDDLEVHLKPGEGEFLFVIYTLG